MRTGYDVIDIISPLISALDQNNYQIQKDQSQFPISDQLV